ncbi:formin-like protein 14 [Papio anubis]|uniref:formin-like protein 14 n=1 Tax=Papio anubis TaxID=9555 RepID=UPI0012AE7CFF|nr:formin-like protein 14 [Papio anubis]
MHTAAPSKPQPPPDPLTASGSPAWHSGATHTSFLDTCVPQALGLAPYPPPQRDRSQRLSDWVPPTPVSPSSATLVTSAGSPSCDLSPTESPARPLGRPTALFARGSSSWVGRAVAQQQDLRLRVNPPPPLSPPKALPSPCSKPLREPGGCGLAATLQLVAGDPVPPARPSDGGEEIRLDTHTRTQLGTSPGGSCRLGRAGGRAAAVTAPAAGSGAPSQLGTGGSRTQEGKIPATLTVALLGGLGGSGLPEELSPRTPEVSPSARRVRGCAAALVGQGGCAPLPAERLRSPALRGLRLLRPPVPCPRHGSAPCRTWFQPLGEVRETRPKLHYFSPACPPAPPGSPPRTSQPPPPPPACGARPPLTHTRHAQPCSFAPIHADSLSAEPSLGIRNYWTNYRLDRTSDPVPPRDPPPAPAPWGSCPRRHRRGPRDNQILTVFSIGVFYSQRHFWQPPQESP